MEQKAEFARWLAASTPPRTRRLRRRPENADVTGKRNRAAARPRSLRQESPDSEATARRHRMRCRGPGQDRDKASADRPPIRTAMIAAKLGFGSTLCRCSANG